MVQTNTINLPGLGAGVVRIKGTERALAMSVDGNGRYCYLDPRRGAMLAVAEAARNVACAGARPLGATNCLNFGNPERPAIMWQFAQAVEGIGEACRALAIPITGGNVSLYNETDGKAIYPTPIIGVVGLLQHADRVLSGRFQKSGDAIILLGSGRGELGGSEYLKVVYDRVSGLPPQLDLQFERSLQELVVALADDRLIVSAHDCSDGGMAMTLAECCFGADDRGADVSLDPVAIGREPRLNQAAALFGESASRVIVSASPDMAADVLARAAAKGLPAKVIGRTGGHQLRVSVGGELAIDITDRRARADLGIRRRAALHPQGCLMFDKFREECGVFGIFGHPEAANMTYLGLYALQHRGQESAGIAAADLRQVRVSRAMGYVAETFDNNELSHLPGPLAIGHVRYSTAGESKLSNAQPILIDCAHGQIAICHNGNIVNASELRDELVRQGSIFQSGSDTEVVLHLYARSKAASVDEAIVESVAQVQGAFSFLMLTKDQLVAVRDPHGFRPLALGRLGDATVVCSETCAMDLIGATYVRDVEPGEVLVISAQGVRSVKPFPSAPLSHCVFEHVYFSRPDSYVFGKSVNEVRTNLGRMLAREQRVDADVVVPVPDSGVCAAMGYADEAGIPLRMGLIRNHYVGRTFIQPQSSIRHFGVKVKLNPVRSILENKRVVLVDDSIVRGTTSRKIVKMVRAAGAREVHVRISCPPTISPCFYGVDTPSRSELIGATHTVDEIRDFLEADSLGYLSHDGLMTAVGDGNRSYCSSCYTGHYPVAFPRDEKTYLQLALKLDDKTPVG